MGSRIEDQITLYSELAPSEQAEVERYVAQHPKLIPLLEEAKAFSALLHRARLLHADPPSDEALAYYLATERATGQPLPASLQDPFARISARLEKDPVLAARRDALAQRMDALEAESDTIAQFERLTRQRLTPKPMPHEEPTPQPVLAGTASEGGVLQKAGDRKPMRLLGRVHRLAWWPAAAVLVVGLALYGSLYVAGNRSPSDLDRLAQIDEAEMVIPHFRSASPTSTGAQALYNQAVARLPKTRTHTLGLFVGYDQIVLDEAASLLNQVVALETDPSPLQSQAHFLLAKLALAGEDVEGAKRQLQAVLHGSGWKVTEAEELLHALAETDR